MSLVRSGRALARRGLRIQRRVAVAQALLWPAAVLACVAFGAVTVAFRRSRRRVDTAPL